MDNTQKHISLYRLGSLVLKVCNVPVCSAANGDLKNLLYLQNCVTKILEGMTKNC